MKIAINAMYIVVKVNIFIKNIEFIRKKAAKRKKIVRKARRERV